MIHTEVSAETIAVAAILSACPVGGVVALSAMSQAIGRDIRSARHIIASARRVAQREGGAVFVTERGVGYRRLSAERATETLGTTARKHIRRTAGRTRRALVAATALANDLPPEAQRRAARELSVLGVIEHVAQDKHIRTKEHDSMKPEPVALVMRRFLGLTDPPA